MNETGESYSFKMKGLRSGMGVRMSSLLAFSAAVSLPFGSAMAQVAPTAAPAVRAQVQRPLLSAPAAVRPPVAQAARKPVQLQPGAPVPGNPDYAPQQPEAAQTAPPPPPLPPPVWDALNAQALYYYLTQVGRDGLNAADYDPEGLRVALASGNPLLISKEATDRFNLISSDLALGHIKKPGRTDWFVTDNDLDEAKQDALLRAALASHRITDALNGLLPTHPQYAALKAALAATSEGETSKLDRIRLNMDRWRWLPRDLGQKYIIVNVPGFHATLVENGVNRWKQRAIAGKLSTPTPQLNAMATGVILNPWWEVPKSIEKEAAGKKGFVPVKGADGKIQRWRQPPGPTNALGQLKFVMPNSKAIYLHDTNARSRFNDKTRALSHGCVRTQHILDLATELLGDDNGEWTEDKIKAALDSKKTVQANFVKPVPVYIVYFSSAALLDGTIVDYKDLYGRDATAMAALQMKDGGVSLARKAAPKSETKPAEKVATR
jgi:murein L,D-transpeptidase YcbB/YkuD